MAVGGEGGAGSLCLGLSEANSCLPKYLQCGHGRQGRGLAWFSGAGATALRFGDWRARRRAPLFPSQSPRGLFLPPPRICVSLQPVCTSRLGLTLGKQGDQNNVPIWDLLQGLPAPFLSGNAWIPRAKGFCCFLFYFIICWGPRRVCVEGGVPQTAWLCWLCFSLAPSVGFPELLGET